MAKKFPMEEVDVNNAKINQEGKVLALEFKFEFRTDRYLLLIDD